MSGNNKRTRSVSKLVKEKETLKKKQSKKTRVQGESSRVNESSQGKEQDSFNIDEWCEWWTYEKKKVAKKESLLQVAKDEKEYALSKARVRSVQEDSNDVGFFSDEEGLDAIDYENAHLAFDPEKSPKFHY